IQAIAPNIVIDEQGSLKRTLPESEFIMYDDSLIAGIEFRKRLLDLMSRAESVKERYEDVAALASAALDMIVGDTG
ncbi:hypothetical protein JXB31_04560, partial [Candidatus Woesearchaeota archaeon]|nr:hypothetical protein [Candidatus Woesearchaeota archaeon]